MSAKKVWWNVMGSASTPSETETSAEPTVTAKAQSQVKAVKAVKTVKAVKAVKAARAVFRSQVGLAKADRSVRTDAVR